MPYKRKAYNPKTCQRRVHLTPTLPNVSVKSDHGITLRNPSPTGRSAGGCSSPPLDNANKFAVPQYNTMVRTHAEMEAVHHMSVEPKTGPVLTPRTKAAIAPKVTQKLNFAPCCSVYKDLIPINVNDTIREMERPRSTRPKEPQKCVISEPVLTDYVEKIEQVKLVIPEPELVLDFPPEEFDFLHAYRRIYRYK